MPGSPRPLPRRRRRTRVTWSRGRWPSSPSVRASDMRTACTMHMVMNDEDMEIGEITVKYNYSGVGIGA